MSEIKKGSEFSMWYTSGIVCGISKKENRDNVKSRFAIFTVYDEDGGDPTKVFKFEDQLFPGAMETLAKYKMMGADGQPVKDAKGGIVINVKALKSSEDAEEFGRFLRWPGGLIEEYHLQKGPCYANDVNGEPVLDKNNKPVVKSTIKVFTQVKMYITDENGRMTPKYLNGMGLSENGERLEKAFWQKPVQQLVTNQPAAVAPAGEAAPAAETTADPF